MAKEKNGKGSRGKGTKSDRHVDVYLAPTVRFLHGEITEALCAEIFQDVRTTERERKWTLFALARFWLAVILDPPRSLSQLLEQTRRYDDAKNFLPRVEASAESFFEKCKNLSHDFFAILYSRFLDGVLPKAPKAYCEEICHLEGRFSDIVAIDGSRLDKIAHRLKILWDEKAAVLPGCLTAVYDLPRGIATQLWFDEDAASSEFKRGMVAVGTLKPGTLVLGDRLYCTIQLFHLLNDNQSFGVFRRNMSVKLTELAELSSVQTDSGVITEYLVEAGQGEDRLELRLIVLEKDGKKYEAVTNADRERLSAEDVVRLYPLRWQIERLFYDLKEVLNLKRFYAANPNAVGMQVFAAAMVHAAFRIAQANVAKQVDLPPEELSPAKLFPYLAIASMKLLEAEWHTEEIAKLNPGVELRRPTWKRHPDTIVSLHRIRVQRRGPNRRKREFSPERRKWKSITKVEGYPELT